MRLGLSPVAVALMIQGAQEAPDQNTQLAGMAKEAFNRFGITENYPSVKIVPNSDKRLNGGAIARAAQYESGKQVLFLSKNAMRKGPRTLSEYMEHEASHFADWNKNGIEGPEHSKEWKRLCLALASSPRVCAKERY